MIQFFTSLCNVSKIILFDQSNVSIIVLVDIVFIFNFQLIWPIVQCIRSNASYLQHSCRCTQIWIGLKLESFSEVYAELIQTCKVELFANIVSGLKPLTIFG